jgi:hypothetical protein
MIRTLLLLVSLSFVAACGDQVQKAKPPEKPASPGGPHGGNPHGGNPHAGNPHAGDPHAPNPHGEMPPGHPPVDRGGASRPAGGDPFAEGGGEKPAMAPSQAADPERVVFAGEIALDPAVTVGENFVVFIVAVNSPQERFPVYTKRFPNPKFPFKFEMQEKDQPGNPSQSSRPLYIRAMISDSGDVMKSRNRTTSEKAFPLGTRDVKLTIKP